MRDAQPGRAARGPAGGLGSARDWLDPVWLEEAHAWIRDHVPGPLVGAIDQPYVEPYATALRVPTSDGVCWFKANGPIQRFEAGLTQTLTEMFLADGPPGSWEP